jgi:hypothetical protein
MVIFLFINEEIVQKQIIAAPNVPTASTATVR